MNNISTYSIPLTVDFSVNDTTIASAAQPIKGTFRGIHISAPNLDGTDTYSVTITDKHGATVYTAASLVRNTTTTAFTDANTFYFNQPLVGDLVVTIVTSGAQTADRTFTVTIYYGN